MDDSSEAGTDGDSQPEPSDVDPPAEGMARVRVIHGSPDAPAVDVYVEGSDDPLFQDLPYGSTSAYLDVPAGTYNFQVRAAGTATDLPPVYETGDLEVPEGAIVSALAAGSLTGAGDAFRVIPLVEDFEAAGDGEARVRIVHAGADAPAVDIDVGNDGSAEVQNLPRFDDTGAGGVALPAGQSLQIGIAVDGVPVTAFTTPELPAGADLFVIATGLLDRLPREDQGFGLLAVGAEGSIGLIRQNPIVYALHAGPDAPEVDVCAGSTALSTHFGFGEMSERIQVPPGAYELDLYAAPSGCIGTPATTEATPQLEAGQRYLVIATGEITPAPGEPPLQIEAYREEFRLDRPEHAVLQAVHAASAPAVDVGVVTGGAIESDNLIARDLKWPGISDEIQLEPLTYQVGVAPAGTQPSLPIADFHVPAPQGLRAFAVAAGDLTPEHGEAGFRLIAVDTANEPWTAAEIFAN